MTVDMFDTLQQAWCALCAAYDVTAELPTVGALFEGADPSNPGGAAQIVLVNMLSEIMECTARFSPWYKRPAIAFGVTLGRKPGTSQRAWRLTPQALLSYRALLTQLTSVIEHNVGVILATRFVDELERQPELDSPCRLASCRCTPPRTILVRDEVIASAEIICDACREPFILANRL